VETSRAISHSSIELVYDVSETVFASIFRDYCDERRVQILGAYQAESLVRQLQTEIMHDLSNAH
jgi:hypothetical protein